MWWEQRHRKKKINGKHASNLADVVYITDDNPRYENPKKLEIKYLFTVKNAIVIPDRKLAIKKAIKKLENNDILLVAGKGHEKYQEISGKKYFFDDKEVVLKTIRKTESLMVSSWNYEKELKQITNGSNSGTIENL